MASTSSLYLKYKVVFTKYALYFACPASKEVCLANSILPAINVIIIFLFLSYTIKVDITSVKIMSMVSANSVILSSVVGSGLDHSPPLSS